VAKLFKLWLTKVLYSISRFFKLGVGGTWPGHILLKLSPNALGTFSSHLSHGIVLITGTNGKTTTTKMVVTILEECGLNCVTNSSGANLLNGITSAFVANASLKGVPSANIGVFEVDEAVFPKALEELSPRIVVILNLFRDQLDRYWEVDTIAARWRSALSGLSKEVAVILNADDPTVASLAAEVPNKCLFFGLDNSSFYQEVAPYVQDALFCPLCETRLAFKGYYFSHLGDWFCTGCSSHRPNLDISSKVFNLPMPGKYNYYNATAALLVARVLGLDFADSVTSLKSITPAFGRLEEFEYGANKILILLSKNPVGFNASIRTLREFSNGKIVAFLVLNDNIPDGRDISWIWDVNFQPFEKLLRVVVVSGLRAEDLALRLKYAGFKKNLMYVNRDLKKALFLAVSKLEEGERLYVLPTYSAMLQVRKILTGRSIL